MVRKIINTKLGRIEYCSVGTGIPVLFVHGGHSNCHETLFRKGFDLEKFCLITPSRPGYGETSLTNNNGSPSQTAQLFIELMNALSIEKFIVYGISAGGLTAIVLAANFPDRVSKLILASAVSKKWLDENGKVYKTAKRIFNPKSEKYTWSLIRFFSGIIPGMITKSFYSQFSKNPAHKLRKEDIGELVSAMKLFQSKSGFLNDIQQDIRENTLEIIKCPTLIIHSENDNSVTQEHALHAHKLITNSTLEILKNEWGHLLWIGCDSDIAIKKILKFLSDSDADYSGV